MTTVLLSRLPFWVHVLTVGRAFSGKLLTARFFWASKNCTASRLKARISFLYPPVMCYLDFWSRSNELFMFFGRKKRRTSNLRKNMQHGGTKQWTPCLIWNPGNVKLQTCNCKLKNLMLKVSNITASSQRFSRLKINRKLRDDWVQVSLRTPNAKSYDGKKY